MLSGGGEGERRGEGGGSAAINCTLTKCVSVFIAPTAAVSYVPSRSSDLMMALII